MNDAFRLHGSRAVVTGGLARHRLRDLRRARALGRGRGVDPSRRPRGRRGDDRADRGAGQALRDGRRRHRRLGERRRARTPRRHGARRHRRLGEQRRAACSCGRSSSTTDDDWHGLLGANLHGYFYGCRAAARQMVEQGTGGRIVNVSSAADVQPLAEAVPYITAKGGDRGDDDGRSRSTSRRTRSP